MLLRLVALGLLGYTGYKFVTKQSGGTLEHPDFSDLRLAGGPLSSRATLQPSADEPPPGDPI